MGINCQERQFGVSFRNTKNLCLHIVNTLIFWLIISLVLCSVYNSVADREKQVGELREEKLRNILSELSDRWRQGPTVSWSEVYQTGEKLLEWKTEKKIVGIWDRQPKMITATLEDGVGQGLKMIHHYSRIAGIEIFPMGLMQTEEAIIEACTKQKPDFLGMTILQFDSEERLNHIIEHIPREIQVVVGGPVFKLLDKEELEQKHYTVLNTVSAYLNYLLNWQPD